MKKIAIISVADMRHMSMISIYTNIFKTLGIEYEIICTNRYDDKIENDGEVQIHSYSWKTSMDTHKFYKIKEFIRFSIFAKHIIKEKKYDFLVIWNENTSIILANFLTKYYKNRYCINIRDIGADNKFPFKQIRNYTLKYAVFSTICSEAMKKYLPPYDYITIYSQNLEILSKCKDKSRFRNKDEAIRISFIGYVRFLEENKKIIKAFGNDKRYIVQFFGTGAERLHKFVQHNKYNNVILKGTFPVKQTAELLDKTDIINAYYGNDVVGIDLSLPIKFNYAPYLKIPILLSPRMYCSQFGEQYGFGYTIMDFELLADRLYNWYHKQDYKEFRNNCKKYCDYVNNENTKLVKYIEQLLK